MIQQGYNYHKKYIDTITIIKSALLNIKKDIAIYRAIAEAITQAIKEHKLAEGNKLPPVRILADALSVTPGTITHAYDLLDKASLIEKKVGNGCYVNTAEPGFLKDFSNSVPEQVQVVNLALNGHIDLQETNYFSKALQQLAAAPQFLQQLNSYSPEQGKLKYREAGCRWLHLSGVNTTVNNVVVTHGAQHALFVLLATLARAGTFVAASKLSYPGLLTAARTLGIKLLGLEFDEQGVTPESLQTVLQKHAISILYLTPTLDNPTTITMPDSRRREIAAICRERDIKIISDDALAVISPETSLSFWEIYEENTFVISSVSKALSPALKLGFIAAPIKFIVHIAAVVKSISWSGDNLATEIAYNWIMDGTAQTLRKRQYTEIKSRIKLIEPILLKLGAKYEQYCGHFWLELPEPWRASEIEDEMKKRNILIKTAEAFSVGRSDSMQAIRVAICKLPFNNLKNAIQTLYEIVSEDI